MNATAATIAATIVVLGCGRGQRGRAEAAEPADLAGLRVVIERDLTVIAADRSPAVAASIVGAWLVPDRAWPAMVTAPFRARHPLYAAGFVAARVELAAELLAAHGAVDVRWQYADDPRLAPDQARVRVALPVGRPGAIVTVGDHAVTAVFAHDGHRWRALAGLDEAIVAGLAVHAPACVAPYRRAARPPCLAMSTPALAAVLAADAAALERACTRLHVNGC